MYSLVYMAMGIIFYKAYAFQSPLGFSILNYAHFSICTSSMGTQYILYGLVVLVKTIVNFIYSENATQFCKIFTLLLTTVHTVKSKVKISQNSVAFSEYMNFNAGILCRALYLITINVCKPPFLHGITVCAPS